MHATCWLLAVCFVVPMGALGEGDCPPPSGQPLDDSDPNGDEHPNNTEEPSEDSTVPGSSGSMPIGQRAMGLMVILGVVVGVWYLLMVGRMDIDEE